MFSTVTAVFAARLAWRIATMGVCGESGRGGLFDLKESVATSARGLILLTGLAAVLRTGRPAVDRLHGRAGQP
jgi:hypothetical protein